MTKRNLPLFVILVLVTIIILLAQNTRIFVNNQHFFYDNFLGSTADSGKVVIVAIDDESLHQIGAWPWDRSVFAKTVDNLNQAGIRVIAFDVVFAESRNGDTDLQKALAASKAEIVLAGKLDDTTGQYLSPLPSLSKGGTVSSGYANFESDADGKVRDALLLNNINGSCQGSLALVTSRAYVNAKDALDCYAQKLKVGFSNFSTDADHRIPINYIGGAGSFQRISFKDIYNNSFDASAVKDKIVVIGSVIQDLKSDLQDNLINPVDGNIIPGAEVHANVINTILENSVRYDVSPALQVVIILLIGAATAWAISRLKTLTSALLVTVLSFGYLLAAALLFGLGWIVNVLALPMLLFSYWLAINFWEYYLKRRENLEIRRAFSQYVNQHILDEILRDPSKLKLGGDMKEMTVMFSDIRGFTTISESMEVTALVKYLNRYLTKVTNVILSQDGVIDKYIGDAIMALWGAPIETKMHSYLACKAALAMVDGLNEFNAERDQKLPEIHVGIGINTGEMIAGNLGSEQRFDYSVLGDSVNLASRLEGLTKQYGVVILLGENLVKHLRKIKKDGEFKLRHLDTVTVKGKNKPVKVYELMTGNSDEELIHDYGQAFDTYTKGDFASARKQFIRIAKRFADKASEVMADRCQELSGSPPPDWKGVWTWLIK